MRDRIGYTKVGRTVRGQSIEDSEARLGIDIFVLREMVSHLKGFK